MMDFASQLDNEFQPSEIVKLAILNGVFWLTVLVFLLLLFFLFIQFASFRLPDGVVFGIVTL